MSRIMMVILSAVVAVTVFWIGIGIGAASSSDAPAEYADGDTYWVEVYEDTGDVVIHTRQEFVTDVGDDILVKGEAE
ncbi:MAG: hypothetical protein V8R50_01325 [Clostridia bacterium]